MKNISIRSLFGVILAVVTAGISFGALAQGMTIPGLSFDNPVAGDESLKMLGMIFGGAVDSIPVQGGGTEVMASLMKVFNGAILSLASIMGFYVTVSAVVQTAHDGEVLGKRYSSLWVPVRAVGSVAMLVPAPSFSGVQALILWIAVQGVGLANILFTTGFNTVTQGGGFQSPAFVAAGAKEVVSKMVPIAACMVANAEQIAKSPDSAKDISVIAGEKQTFNEYSQSYKLVYGYKVRGGTTYECGTIRVLESNSPRANGDIDPIAKANLDAQAEAANQAMAIITSGVNSAVDPAAKPTDFVAKAADAYSKIVQQRVMAAFKSAESDIAQKYRQRAEELKNQGWAAFGGSFMVLSKYGSEAAAQAGNTNVEVSSTPVDVIGVSGNSDTMSSIGRLVDAVTKASASTVEGPSQSDGGGSMSMIWSAIKDFFSPATSMKFADSSDGSAIVNPIIKLQKYGNTLILSFIAVMGVIVLLASISSTSSKASEVLSSVPLVGTAAKAYGSLAEGVKSGIATFLTFFAFFFVSALVLGLTMAVYIPMIPYIVWVSVVVAWLVAVTEAVIAAPLWMMLHLNPEGDGIATGATETGYKFVAAVFLRPALSVIAGFAACLVLIAVGSFIFRTMDAVASDSINGFAALLTWLAQIAILAGIFMTLVSKTFGLALSIPEQILRWIGSSLTGGSDLEGGTANQFNAAAGMVVKAGGDVQARKYSAAQQAAALKAGRGGVGPSTGGLDADTDAASANTGRQGLNTDVQDGNTTK